MAVGPSTIASIRYVERYGIGLAVTRPDSAEIASCLQKLKDKNLWSVMADRSRRLFREQHYAPVVRSRFASIIEQAVKAKVNRDV